MVAWVVNDRLNPRRTPPSSFLLPPSLAPIPILEPTPPSSLKESPLSFHALMRSPFCNPFAFKFMHVMGGTPPRRSDVQTFKRFGVFPIYPLSFQFFLDTPTQRPLINPFAINSLRPLFIATEGVPPPSIFFSPPPTARATQFLAPASREALP